MEITKRLKAVSDETRLRILHLLLDHELNVNEIVSIIGMIQSGISRHLKVLMESGLLSSRKDGSYIYYSALNSDHTQGIIRLIRKELANEDLAKQDISSAATVLENRGKKTKDFFRHVAKEWDELKRQVIGDLDINRLVFESVKNCPSIADLGCGTGELLELLNTGDINPLIGVDSSIEMLNQAKARLNSFQHIDLRLGELEHLPMGNEEIHCVIMNMVLHHIAMPQKVIQEAYRVMAPQGLFIISDFEKHDNERIRKVIGGAWLGLDSTDIDTWLTTAGFKLQTTKSYPVNHNLYVNMFCAQKQ